MSEFILQIQDTNYALDVASQTVDLTLQNTIVDLVSGPPLLTVGELLIGAVKYNSNNKRPGMFYAGEVDPTNSIRLNYDGNLHVSDLNAINVNSTSDINEKTDVVTIGNALNSVLQMRGVRFKWKNTGIDSIGVIAQEMEQILPEVVHTSDTGRKTVSYGNIIGVLIEAIKDQQQQIDELKVVISRVHKENEDGN